MVIGVGLAFAPVASAASRPAEVPLIAAASSLRPALEEISARFTAETGRRVRFSYASSGVLAMQILRGAPVELFLSADEAYVDRLVDRGAVSERGKVYARGRLVIFVTHGADVDIDRRLRRNHPGGGLVHGAGAAGTVGRQRIAEGRFL